MIPKSALPNIKPQRGLGQAVTRQRRKALDGLRREREERLTKSRDAARNELRRLADSRETDEEFRWKENLIAAVVSSQTAVVRSYGLTQPIKAGLSSRYIASWRTEKLVAYTDFREIVIKWPVDHLPQRNAKTEVVLDTVAQIRGVIQHELGHILHTVPLNLLVERTLGNTDSPLFNRHVPINGTLTRVTSGMVHKPWNILEDQRMETAMVRDVPRLATYFTSMTVAHVISDDSTNAWLLLAGRQYLPAALREQARDLFAQSHGDALTDEWLQIVNAYKRATTHDDLMSAVVDALVFLSANVATPPDPGTEHRPGGQPGRSEDEDDLSESASDPEDEGDDEPQESGSGEGKGTSESDDESNDEPTGAGGTSDSDDESTDGSVEGEGEQGGQDEGDESQVDTQSGKGRSKQITRKDLQETAEEVLSQAKEELRQERDNQSILADAYERTNSGGTLGDATFSAPDLPTENIQRAERVSAGIEQALTDFVTASQPVWMSHQEKGIIDPLAFRTKSVGDMDYHRAMSGEASNGLDLHVSMLSDVSVSMSNDMLALSEALYATATACQRLGIGATFSLWSDHSENYRIWGDGNVAPSLWSVLGGTDPTRAMDDIHSHNPEGATNHLVLIFTDGDWGSEDNYNLQNWSAPGRHIVIVRYGASYAPHYGADEAIDINNVDQLPMELTRAIQRILSK